MKLNNRKNMEIIKFKAGGKNSNHVHPNTRAEVFIYTYVEPHTHTHVCVCVCARASTCGYKLCFIFLPQ